MNTEYLRYILVINEHRSINKAAKALYITQPTLSRILQSIEDSTGITIFTRNNRGVEVTEDGETFIKRIHNMLAVVDQMQHDYFDVNDEPEDMVKLIIGAHRSSPALDAFIRYYKLRCQEAKHVNLVFQEEVAEEVIDGVSKGLLDLGVIHFISSRENDVLEICNGMNLVCAQIDDGYLYAQISSEHPLAVKETIRIKDLKPYTHITFSDEDLSGINYCSNISKFDWHTQNKRIVTNSRGALRSLIINSNGYYLGNNAQCELLDLEGAVSIPISDYPYTVKTAYIYTKDRELTEEERIYIKCVSDIYRKSNGYAT